MKTSIIIACLGLFCCINSIHAQWYANKYGVENLSDLSNGQLMEGYSHAKTLSIAGGVVTGTGVGLMIGGFFTGMKRATEDIFSVVFTLGSESPSHDTYGGGLFFSGAVLALGGTITWITGGTRKKQISPLIKSRGLVSNISVYPGAAHEFLTDTYYPAVTVSIRF